ncbi:MAG: DUF4340 domain-containing protein [Clostridia bacterium]|nr:DUF4340 domain-containing protein [Clostridia bacterium]
MQEIQLFFNPGKGTVPLIRITAVVGDRVGAMPKPTRKGYIFDGWYMSPDGDPDSVVAIRVTSETELDDTLLGGYTADIVLYARWKKPESKNVAGKKSSFRTQKRAIAVLLILAAVLAIALGVVSVIVDIYEYEDLDGTEYTIKKKKGEYGLYQDGMICDVNKDGYYLTDLGTQLEIDPETGEYEIYAVVDTEGTEVVGVQQRVLMFKQLTYDQSSTKDMSRVIKSFEIHNQKGSFTLVRGESNRFEVKDHPTAILVDELFAQLSNGCGYTISMQRLENPVRLPDGSIDYSEYGLAPETRTEIDEEGKALLDKDGNPVTYDYVPTWYTVTTMTNDEYTVTLGDATISGAGYYARYEDRDTVYILSSINLDAAVLQPIESLIAPMMVYPMSLNTYFQVSNFTYYTDIDHDALYLGMLLEVSGLDPDVLKPDENGEYSEEIQAQLEAAAKQIEEMDEAEFTKLYDRYFSQNSRLVTSFSFIDMDERTDTLYSSLPYQMSSDYMAGYLPNSDNIGSVLQALYSMTFDGVAVLGPTDEDLDAYGLSNPAHEFAFIYKDAQGQEWSNHFVVSEKTEDGMYYGYSEIYDMIVRIPESQATYLEWEEIDWYEREYFMFNIAHVQQIKLEGAGITTPIVFTLDNSKSDQSKGMNSDKLEIYANGELMDYTLTVTKPSGSQTTETSTYNFKRFFQALLTASMEGNAELSEEEMQAFRETPDDECYLKITIHADDGKGKDADDDLEHTADLVYRFYRYTERKSYFTVEVLDGVDDPGSPENGQGKFYVLHSFCDKLIADAHRFMEGTEIVVNSKN